VKLFRVLVAALALCSAAPLAAQSIVSTQVVDLGHISAQIQISYEEQSWPVTAVTYQGTRNGTITFTATGAGAVLTNGTAVSFGPRAASSTAVCGLTGLDMVHTTTQNVTSVSGDDITFTDPDTATASAWIAGTWTNGCGRLYKNLPSGTTFEYGLTTSYGSSASAMAVTLTPQIATAYLTSLAPGTQYFYRWTLPGGATSTGSFTTLASGAVEEPVAPTPVADVVKTGPVGGTYNADINVNSDCSNLGKTSAEAGTVMAQLAALTGSNHQRVIFPAGTVCQEGQYIWPPRPNHSGWVVVKSSTEATALPPAGVRFTPPFAAGTYKFLHTMNVSRSSSTSATSLPAGTDCQTGLYGGEDGFYGLSVPAGHFPHLMCSSTKFPAYTGNVHVTGASGTTSGPVTWDIPGHTITKGMIVKIPSNTFTGISTSTGQGNYYVQSVVPGVSITLHNNKRASSGSTLDAEFDVQVLTNWRMPNVTEGTTDPTGPCDEGTGTDAGRMFYHNTVLDRSFWCVDDTGSNYASTTGVWRRINKIVQNGSFAGFAAVRIDPAASRYHIIGMEVAAAKVPNPPPSGWFIGHNSGGLSSYNRQGGYMTLLDISGSQVIIDRAWLHAEAGAAPPIRIHNCAIWYAHDSALVNSYLDDCVNWQYNGYGDFEGSDGISHAEGGPAHIENNFITGGTIAYYSEDTPGILTHDLLFRRNTITKHKKWQRGSAEHTAAYAATPYPNWSVTTRNGWEWKQGHRALIEGNVSERNWTSWTAGQHFTLTTRKNSYTNFPDETIASISSAGVITISDTCRTTSFSAALATTPCTYIRTGDWVRIRDTSNSAHNYLIVQVTSGCDYAITCNVITVSGLPASSSTGGYVRQVFANRGVRDINMRWNVLRNSTDVVRMLSYEGVTATDIQTPFIARVAFTDNLVHDSDGRAYGTGRWNVPSASFSGGQAGIRYYYSLGNVEHHTVARNSVYSLQGTVNRLIMSEQIAAKDYGLVWKDDIFYAVGNVQSANTESSNGTSALNAGWANYTVGNIVICCGFTTQVAGSPNTIKWPSSLSNMSWTKPALDAPVDLRLRYDSRFCSGCIKSTYCTANPSECSAASNRGDMGVDVDVLDSKIGTVSNVRVRSVTSTSAIVSYLAPDSFACTVEYSTSPTWGTGTRALDDGSVDRVRNVSLSGLTPGTDYKYRVLCAVEQPSGTFRTPSN
jgi:hypothetical protein